MARFVNTGRDLYDRHHEHLWQLHRDEGLRAVVHAEIPLTEAATAHELIEARANLGMVVLRP
ncbi:hypothetical protein [Plantactinospora sp. B24E8]|uniref:hypothetical protein n=1 Tax=Plantactinospora sp. B24E8 TaxID=3153567 RepID=UPI00325C8F62